MSFEIDSPPIREVLCAAFTASAVAMWGFYALMVLELGGSLPSIGLFALIMLATLLMFLLMLIVATDHPSPTLTYSDGDLIIEIGGERERVARDECWWWSLNDKIHIQLGGERGWEVITISKDTSRLKGCFEESGICCLAGNEGSQIFWDGRDFSSVDCKDGLDEEFQRSPSLVADLRLRNFEIGSRAMVTMAALLILLTSGVLRVGLLKVIGFGALPFIWLIGVSAISTGFLGHNQFFMVGGFAGPFQDGKGLVRIDEINANCKRKAIVLEHNGARIRVLQQDPRFRFWEIMWNC